MEPGVTGSSTLPFRRNFTNPTQRCWEKQASQKKDPTEPAGQGLWLKNLLGETLHQP